MSDKGTAQDVIEGYQKRQQRTPRMFVVGAIALVLIFAGVVLLIRWISNPNAPLFPAPPSETPTATSTLTPTPVTPTATPPAPTNTLPPTEPPTETATPTIEGPFLYTVQEGDSLFSIAEQFGVDVNRLLEVNELEFDSVLFVGQQVLIPDPNEEPPTATPIPEGLPRGTLIEYRVITGDTLTTIALKFNSTEDAILEANESIENPNEIFVGQVLSIPVNLVTPAPTATGQAAGTPGAIMTLTPAPTDTPQP